MDNPKDPTQQSATELAELERTWMAHELHDGLMQWVVGAKMQAESLQARSMDGKAPTAEQLQYLCTLLSRAVLEGRRLMAGLRPPELDESDWHVAIAQWANIAGAGGQTAIEFHLEPATRSISDAMQRGVFRIVQESVGNALRHAKAETIQVDAKFVDSNLIVSIQDNGIGFNKAEVGVDRYGLKGIHERAALLDGSATISSKPGSGTVVEVSLPR
ncbi:Signal transduction histidine-protein kinase/phosphatase DegS [Rosistilla carotiformis]|uniref:Signal transduction histidine-protein kinase/phosphatase DegS n=1 Tax=Rosistilla carotiformis TaxID=2528017 RepID=A0A518JRS7_9BACT|nr:sensor histidine kinase [Rosistilla carotiformis]QDV68230.1 Signal transduction histidine-protein kinase/phosphatase DegS [Rosistilla carotiformis]